MATLQPDEEAPRRVSFSSTIPHRHTSIPNCDSSDPNNPIPCEPKNTCASLSTMSHQSQADIGPDSSSSSNGESLDTVHEESSDTDTSASTAPTESSDESPDSTEKTDTVSRRTSAQPTNRPRRGSTISSNTDDIKRILGDGTGTTFLEKYCCGKGCCMKQTINAHPEHIGVDIPGNDTFKFFDLNVEGLSLDTQLTHIADLPEQTVSFGSLRRESISAKFPEEAEHTHDEESVNTYPPEYMKPHPPYNIFNAPVHGARELTKPGAEKRTFHFDIDVTDYPEEGGVDFKVGGAVGICPPNDPYIVNEIMDQLCIPRYLRDKPIRMYTTGGRWPTIWGEEESRELLTTRREVLTWTVDIASTPPTKPLLRLLAEYAEEIHEKQILLYLCSAQGQAAFCDLRTGPHITLQQLLHAFPSSRPSLEELCSVLNQLMPRFYSLSNDPHISSERDGLGGRRLIETAVTVHNTQAPAGSSRRGVGSGFLERLAMRFIQAEERAQQNAKDVESSPVPGVAGRKLNLQIPMFRGLMANPLSKEFASDGPMVLIGAGVGMAPFRGFILNRLKNANCANKIWLIQGIRDSLVDELYQGELGEHEKEIKKVVQSRVQGPPPVSSGDPEVEGHADDTEADQLKKESRKQRKVAKYVQDEVRLQADIVWYVINAVDGRIFVCGSTSGMGEGVERALIDVAMDKGNLDYDTARQFWKDKAEGNQYIAETW